MSLGALIVITLRLLVPFLLFKRNLAGGIACMLVDAFDVILIDLMHLGGLAATTIKSTRFLIPTTCRSSSSSPPAG